MKLFGLFFSLSSIYVCLVPYCSVFVASQAKSACAKKRTWLIDEAYSEGTRLKSTRLLCLTVHLYWHITHVIWMQYTNQQVCFHDVLCSQGNVAFKSPWGAWSFPAVCRMGAPRPAAGKKPVPLRLHSLSSSSQVELCQYQSALAEEAQQWLVTAAQPNLVVIRGLCTL